MLEEVTGEGDRIDWAAFAAEPNTHEAFLESLPPGKQEAMDRFLAETNQTMDRLSAQFELHKRFLESDTTALEKAELLDQVLHYFRAQYLRKNLKLDPAVIVEITEKYGYIDFRLPEAHAVYWAWLGLKHAENGRDLPCERMIFQSLSNAAKSGTVVYISTSGQPFLGPNAEAAEGARIAYLAAYENHV